MRTRLLPALTAAALLTASLPSDAFGLAGTLTIPSLSFPSGFKSESIMRVISDKAFSFLGGQFVNGSTTLRYDGTAAKLNEFLAKLVACPGVKVSVSFSEDIDAGAKPQKPGELPAFPLSGFSGEWEADAWRLGHNSWGDPASMHVTVNSKVIKKGDVKPPK